MIELDHVTQRYGETAVVDDLSLTVAEGEFLALIGPSGSGKSTTLRMVNRLVTPTSGSIRIRGQDALSVKPEELRRRIGYVIQSGGLFPHWTVERNIGTVPELLGWPKPEIRARVGELLGVLSLDPGSFRDKYPHQLSGGEQQRVGVARALAARPEILLMDEPFGALDPVTRVALQGELKRLHRETGTTTIFVTHDMGEALALATRIAVLDRGRLVQVGSPLEIVAEPAADLVRDMIGRDERGLQLLALETVATRLRAGDAASGEPVSSAASLRLALSRMVATRTDRLPVIDEAGRPLGAIHLADLIGR